MSLATRCPLCHTSFRVSEDQLKLRDGLVRCGACKQVFNGREHLLIDGQPVLREGTAEPYVPTPGVPDPLTRMTLIDVRSEGASVPVESLPTSGETSTQSAPLMPSSAESAFPAETGESEAGATATHRAEDLRKASTQEDTAQEPPSSPQSPNALQSSTPDRSAHPSDEDVLPAPVWRPRESEPAVPSPDEDTQPIQPNSQMDGAEASEGRASNEVHRRRRSLWAIGCTAAGLLLLIQAPLIWRAELAAVWPVLRPALETTCRTLGCDVSLPMNVEKVSIESSELQALPASDDSFVLGLLLRNRSSLPQAWPHLELTLNDADDQPVLRRSFSPAEYLTEAERQRGMTARAEKPVRLMFNLVQLKATGYRLYVYYP